VLEKFVLDNGCDLRAQAILCYCGWWLGYSLGRSESFVRSCD
jgi:hypothetical protein